MKKLICAATVLISFNSFAGILVGECNGLQIIPKDNICKTTSSNGWEFNIPFQKSFELATMGDLNDLRKVVEKNNSDINHLKDLTGSEVEIPSDVIAKIKEELREELKQELLEELKK